MVYFFMLLDERDSKQTPNLNTRILFVKTGLKK